LLIIEEDIFIFSLTQQVKQQKQGAAPTENRTQGNCLESYVATTPLALPLMILRAVRINKLEVVRSHSR
jgi:hypothetical protein